MNAHKWKKTPICSSCMTNFAVKEIPVGRYGKKFDTSRQPYVMQCGHSFCGECITNASKTMKILTCLVCQKSNLLPEPGENMLSKLPIDAYALGVLWANRPSSSVPNQIKMRFIPAGMTTPPVKQKRVETEEICEECLDSNATLLCKQCTFMFCARCFSKVHKSKALSKHEAQILLNENSGCRLPTTCQEHRRPIEFFCTDDDEYICSHCIIVGPHKGHGMLTISEKNEQSVQDVKTVLPEARKILRNLRFADKQLAAVVPQVEAGSNLTVNQIMAAFQHLHGVLQLREHELISEVMEFFSNENCPVEKLKSEVSEQLKFLKILVQDAEQAISKPEDNYNLLEILKKLRQSSDQPCHLVTLDKGTTKESEVKFTLSDDIQEQLRIAGEISAEAYSRYKLIPLNEAPPEFLECIPDDDSPESDDTSSVTSSVFSAAVESITDNESICDKASTVQASSSSSKASTTKSRPGSLFRQELVYVTHIYDPSHFMVQRLAKSKDMDQITKMVNALGSGPDAERVDTIEKDQFVLAKYTLDNKWYRGQITRIIRHINTEEPSSEDEPDLKVEVKYIDYGNTEELPISRLRQIPRKLLIAAAQSLRCSLYGIIPANQTELWSVEACHTFGLFAKAKALHMVVMENAGAVLHVDLRKSGAQDIILNDAPISIRDALVFLELACYVFSESSWTEGARKTHQQQQYYSSELPAKHSTKEVVVSHINSPHDFYIQQLGDHARFLSTLMFELQDVYKQQQDDSWTVYCPYKGMPCVAQFEVDHKWYRVRVDDLPGKSMVKVTYVDFGNTATVSWQSLRKVADRFMKLPVQAIPCSLVDIQPADPEKGWIKKVSNSFLELVSKNSVKIYVQAVSEMGLAVTLYDMQEDRDTCINALLVKSGLAISTGPNSTIVEFPRGEQEPVKDVTPEAKSNPMSYRPTISLVPSDSFVSSSKQETPPSSPEKKGQLSKVSSPVTLMSKPSSPLSKCTIKSIAKLTKTSIVTPASPALSLRSASTVLTSICPTIKSLPTALATGDCQLPPSIPVTVSYFESPDCFYIQTLLPDTRRIDNFQLELQKVYSNKVEPSTVEWKPNNLCAAKYSIDKKWYRAKILKILDGGKALVQLIDYGYKDEVSFDNLHSLSVSQMKERMFAVCCSLAGIQPAGDPKRWSRIACEYLTELLQNHEKLFLVKKADVKRGNLPVDLLYENVEYGGALEPSKTTYISIADKLRDQGLALRKRGSASSSESHSPSPEPQELLLHDFEKDLDLNSQLSDAQAFATSDISSVAEISTLDIDSSPVKGCSNKTTCTVKTKGEKKLKKSRRKLQSVVPMHKVKSKVTSGMLEDDSVLCAQEDCEKCSDNELLGCNKDETLASCCSDNIDASVNISISHSMDKAKRTGAIPKSPSRKSKSRERRHCGSDTAKDKCDSVGLQHQSRTQNKSEDLSESHSVNQTSSPLTFSPPSRDIAFKEESIESVSTAGLSLTAKWKKAELPKVAVFTAIATHVDYGCIIYVQDTQGAHQHVTLIKQAMQTKYTNSEPQAHDYYWFPGDSCISQFPVDNCWYRARVLHVYDDSVEVQFVDYGNTETLKPKQLRKQLCMTNIPIQCYACELRGLKHADGEWPERILSFIHNAIVEKEVTVTLLEPPIPGQNLKISLVMHDGTNLEELLVDMEIAKLVRVKTRTVQSPYGQEYSTYEYPYELQVPPGIGETIPIIVTNLMGTEVYIQLVPYKHPTTQFQEEYNAKINEQNNAFLALSISLNDVEEFQPLENPRQGDAVCCKYSLDNHWYRGLMLEEKDSNYHVLFVDYGNQQIMKKEELRTLPTEFRSLPLLAINCYLHQVVADNGQWTPELNTEMNLALHQEGMEYFAVVKDHEEPMKIDIYSCTLDNPDAPLVLAYQDLIDVGLIRLVRVKTAQELL